MRGPARLWFVARVNSIFSASRESHVLHMSFFLSIGHVQTTWHGFLTKYERYVVYCFGNVTWLRLTNIDILPLIEENYFN